MFEDIWAKISSFFSGKSPKTPLRLVVGLNQVDNDS